MIESWLIFIAASLLHVTEVVLSLLPFRKSSWNFRWTGELMVKHTNDVQIYAYVAYLSQYAVRSSACTVIDVLGGQLL